MRTLAVPSVLMRNLAVPSVLMRTLPILLAVAFLSGPALAQDPAGEAKPVSLKYESSRYQVRITGPQGWMKTMEGPKPAGSWVDLVQFDEPRTKATVLLSAAATHYRGVDEMIQDLTQRFEKDSGMAILRQETRGATAKRPKGVLFEYTVRGKRGPVHAIAAYYLHLGKRFRVLGTVKEAAWRSVGTDIEAFAGALEFTGRAFSKQVQNYSDEARNFSIYFPETWTVKLPARGPRVVFTSSRLGVAVWIYANASKGSLSENVTRTVKALEEQKAKLTKQGRVKTHHALGVKTVELEYSRTSGTKKFLYRETAVVHRDRFYRVVLVGSGAAMKAGRAHYEKMLETLSFTR